MLAQPSDRGVADEAFEPADGHRFKRLADRAHALALVLLRTDAATDRRQQAGLGQDVVGAAQILFADFLMNPGMLIPTGQPETQGWSGQTRQRSASRMASSG